uniref:F-box DNA helicase 1 n=1 Tax=Sinocyclocheilus grahami TaxID=75366 RepID=A0A672RTW2_SINGR
MESTRGRAKRRHLGPSECSDLLQSNPGDQSLTQPFNANLSNADPNRALQPRTPTKRSRQASGGVGQQKGITDFFSVSGVISTSPQKGTKTPVKEENEEQEPIGHLIPKEENLEEDKMEDYMEGITEDMFDEDFEVGTTSVKKEEELLDVTVRKEEDLVEALLDAHYGLLGVQEGQEVPKGHVQDLPEEVLREVFAHLPADDLYRNISLVCHHWRAVVMDPQFLPWKRLYCRYRKRQNEALKEVKSILDDNQINKKDDLCLLNMVRYMSQFKHSKRVNVKDVLACVKGHQLYAHAEACIKDRMPDMVDDESPNPWSAMALMLILADGVKDVLDLVALLRKSGCLLTAGGISEYLWAVATLLLAMRKNNINISNRWHYNIFYVLHLMENAPPPVGLQDNRQQITHEQQQILNHDIQNHHVVKIMAFAGTGKTTTLVKYAQQRSHMRFLYLAFNKSVAMQAQRSFPHNVECSTVHSMAFRSVGVRYKNMRKLSSNLQVFDVAWILPKGHGGFVNAKVVTQTFHNFCASVDQHVGPQHVPYKYKNTHGQPEYPDDHQKTTFAGLAQKLWDQMVELKSRKERVYNMTHDGYLKLWQLSRPQLDRYDAIFIDEAQDCTPEERLMLYMLLLTHTSTISHRFGSEIAYVGAAVLDSCKKVKQILVGGNQEGSVRGEDTQTLQQLKLGQRLPEGSVAILSRCNVTVFSEAVRLTDVNPNCKIYIVGGVENFGLDKIMDLWVLMQPEDKRKNGDLAIKDYFIRSFCKDKMGGFRGLKGYAMASEDRELEAKLAVVEKYNKRIPELVKRIYDRAQKSAVCADFILGTVHKAKGLEFDAVVVTDDFMKVPCGRHNLQSVGGFNAVIVCTSGRSRVYISDDLKSLDTFCGFDCMCHHMDAGGVLCLTCAEQRVGPTAFLLSPPERVRSMTYTNERIELPINVAMLLSLL